MANSFKYSGNIGFTDDTQLWREIVKQEYKASNDNKDIFLEGKTQAIRPKTGNFRNSVFTQNNNTLTNQLANLKRSQQFGTYKDNYLNDQPNHHSDPAYVTIKPGYRAHKPMPNFNQLDMKNRYSFDPNGKPKIVRNSQDRTQTIFRNTLQIDTPYYRDDRKGPFNMKHALVDPTHTFQSYWPDQMRTQKKKLKQFDRTDLKGDRQMTETNIQEVRRVTYGINGEPILRLNDRSACIVKGQLQKSNPIETYKQTKQSNDRYFKSKHLNTMDNRKAMASMNKSSSDIANEFMAEHLENKHRHSASVKNLNTLNMGVKSSTQSFTNQSFVSGKNQTFTSVRPKSSVDTGGRKNKVEKYRIIQRMLKNQRQANKHLKDEMETLAGQIQDGKSQIQQLVNK